MFRYEEWRYDTVTTFILENFIEIESYQSQDKFMGYFGVIYAVKKFK